MIDDFIRKNEVHLISILLCALMIFLDSWATVLIGFDWQLLMTYIPFPIILFGNVLALFTNKESIGITVKMMKVIFPILILETGLITILNFIRYSSIIDISNSAITLISISNTIGMIASILTIICIISFIWIENHEYKVNKA